MQSRPAVQHIRVIMLLRGVQIEILTQATDLTVEQRLVRSAVPHGTPASLRA